MVHTDVFTFFRDLNVSERNKKRFSRAQAALLYAFRQKTSTELEDSLAEKT